MTSTGLTITKNDGTEQFTLKSNQVKSVVSMGVVTKALLGGISSLSGGDPTLSKETFEINGVIREMEAADYPNSGTYADDDLGFSEELRRACKEWRPTTSDGLNTLEYDTGTDLRGPIDGLLTEVQITENRDNDAPRQYGFTLEWTHYDVYVG
jgi:hypothetical protein